MKAFSIAGFLFAVGALLLSGCAKSEVETACLPAPIPTSVLLMQYFDNYKEGNYWIYSTADSLQTDSFYVTQRIHGRIIDKNCRTEDSTVITAYSKALNLTGGNAVFEINKGGDIVHGAVQSLQIIDAAGFRILSLDAFDEMLQFHYYCPGCDIYPPEAQPVQKLHYNRKALLSGQVLDTVWEQFGTVIAPKWGIVQFVKPNTQDTFYLQRTRF